MNSDEKKSDDYWMGVRDALRMIDSFVRWSQYNPKKAKSLEDFIADGLVAAAKRCKSCLSKELGIDFKEEKDTPEDSLEVEETSVPAEVPVFFEESSLDAEEPSTSPEIHEVTTPSESASEKDFPDPFFFIDSSPSDTEEKVRDFSSDFELAEPEPLIIKPKDIEPETPSDFKVTGPPEEDMEEVTSIPDIDFQDDTTPSIDEKEISNEEESTKIPRFSWADDDDDDEISPESTSSIESVEESPILETLTKAKVRIWSPYDEPSITESDSDSISTETEDAEDTESDTSTPTTEEPPSPPPPPETDETEEERKRRARRLFFGT